MPHGIKGWSIFVLAQFALTALWKFIIKLAENAMLGWGDDQIAAWLGITSSSAAIVFAWSVPLALGGATLLVYHFFHQRWSFANREVDIINSSTISQTSPPNIQTIPPSWTPLTTIRQWAAQAGWNMDENSAAGHNDAREFCDILRQAAVRGTINFEGRLYDTMDWPMSHKGQQPFVPISSDHFKDFGIDTFNFLGAKENYDIFTGQWGKQRDLFKGKIFRDLHADTAQIQNWLAKVTKNNSSAVGNIADSFPLGLNVQKILFQIPKLDSEGIIHINIDLFNGTGENLYLNRIEGHIFSYKKKITNIRITEARLGSEA